jgi:hypothetical protein
VRSGADGATAPFEQDDVAPLAGVGTVGHVSEPAPNADLAEAGAVMQCEAGRVLREHPTLERPDACRLRREVVPDLVELEVAVPRLTPTVR